jgi:two-component system sensor histidine kinase/response regulator
MMEIACTNCRKKYRIDEKKLTADKVRIPCKACGEHITVIRPDVRIEVDDPPAIREEKTAETAERAAAPNRTDAAVEKVSWFNSIQVRVSLALFLSTTVILAGFIAYNYVQTRQRLDREFNTLADITASRLAIHLMESLWDLDEKQAGDSLEAEMLDRQIHSIIVRESDDNTIFSGRTRDGAWRVTNAARAPAGNLVKSSKTIQKAGEQIGTVEVFLTSRFMEADFRQSILNIIITAVILLFSIFIVLYISMRTMIINPIMRLTDVAEKMSMGVMDADIDIRSRNEIGLLASALDRMQTSLRMAIERLRKR